VHGRQGMLTGKRRPLARLEQEAQHLQVSAGDGAVRWSGAVACRPPPVSPRLAEVAHGMRRASFRGDVQGRQAAGVRLVDGGAVPAQAAHHRDVAPARGRGQGRPAALSSLVRGGRPGLAQERSDPRAAVEAGDQQRRDALGAGRIWDPARPPTLGKLGLQAGVELVEQGDVLREAHLVHRGARA